MKRERKTMITWELEEMFPPHFSRLCRCPLRPCGSLNPVSHLCPRRSFGNLDCQANFIGRVRVFGLLELSEGYEL